MLHATSPLALSPVSSSSCGGGKRFLFPALIAAGAFLSGIVFSFAVQPRLLQHHPAFYHPLANWTNLPGLQAAPVASAPRKQAPVHAANSQQPPNRPPAVSEAGVWPQQMPLGLQWYKGGYENPWQFSVSRTGIAELQAAYERVLKRDGKMPRVVVSFTSLPRRFVKHARGMVQLLKQQSFTPDQIYVAIPKMSRRSNDSFQIPSWLANDPLVTVLRPEVDYGPATKLIPALMEEKRLGNEKTRIVTVDDDDEGGWTNDVLLSMLAYSLVFEDAAIGRTGWNATCIVTDAHCSPEDSGTSPRQYPDRFYNFIKQADDYACHSLGDWLPDYFPHCMGAVRKNYVAYADVIEGYRGALYQPRFFDLKQVSSIMDKKKTPEYFFLCDDVWFSGWLSVRGVKRLIMNAAIDKGSDVRKALMGYGKKRKLPENLSLLPETEEDKKIGARAAERGGAVEEGLHSMGLDFTSANHDAVRWFEKKGAWTKGMWDRPGGFVYPSDRERKE